MAENQVGKWLRGLGTNIVTNLVVFVIVALITGTAGYFLGKRNLSGEVADGIRLLELDSTSESLTRLVTSFDQVSSLLREPTPHPAKASVAQLTDSLERLSEAIDGVRTTEYYSVKELKELYKTDGATASTEIRFFGAGSSQAKFIKENIGKPKRTVEGLAQVKPRLEIVRDAEAKIALQLEHSSTVDVPALQTALSEMKLEAGTALSSFNSGREKTLATLKRFGKPR